MQSIENHDVSKPLVLTSKQRDVLEALKSKQTDKYRLSDMYLGALYALNNHHNPDRIAQAANSLRELLEKLPRVVQGSDIYVGPTDFKEMRRSINDRILKDKERYPEGWRNKKVDARLDKTLRKIEKYFERNQQPTRSEKMQHAVATIDPMAHSLNSGTQERKRNQIYRLWQRLEGFTHHNSDPDGEEFSNCLEELENIISDLLALRTAQDQKEIQTILSLSNKSKNDIERMFALIERRGANFVFFFKQISENTDVTWLPELEEKGYFAHPPNVQLTDDGSVIFPFWWPIQYLAKICRRKPDEVVEIVSRLPEVDNPRVYDGILDVVLQLHEEKSGKLKPKMLEYVGIDYQFFPDKYAKLLAHWTMENQTSAALELLKVLVAFTTSPQSADQDMLFDPLPRIDAWSYRDVMFNGVRPLAEEEPYQVSLTLINTTANMIYLQTHPVDRDKEEDGFELWCQQLRESDGDYEDLKEALVHTLTFACEKVFEKSPNAVADLNETLRSQQWKLFKRLRHHLYAQYPNEQTKPWIREQILARENYNQWGHPYEFQQMIRSACEYFGEALFTQKERMQIFDAIYSDLSREDFRERMGESFTEEDFQQHKRDFHRRQFTPFAPVLFGKYETYFRELENEVGHPISDEDYQPIITRFGFMSNHSPRSSEDLATLPDGMLLTYINEWDEEDRLYRNGGFTDINIKALAEEFQTVFRESIISDANRLRFWMENSEKIERPIYVQSMVKAMQAHVKEKNFDKLNEWLAFSEWVLNRPNQDLERDHRGRDKSRENPDWSSTRRAVGDFISVCLEKDVDVPIAFREQLAKLLERLCTQFDWRLDNNRPVFLNRDDPLAEGINNTRSRALESLVEFGFWLRRNDSMSDVSEVKTILEKRFTPNTEYSLTLPEYAILGRSYYYIFNLDTAWTIRHKSDFFPQEKLSAWLAAFKSFVVCNSSSKQIFEILQCDFSFALQHLSGFKGQERSGKESIDIFGQRLFTYYLWGVYPLRGGESLIERFYTQTDSNRECWANLFSHVGFILKNSKEELDQNLRNRIITFCEWRLKQEDPTELQNFTPWLEAECLDPEWRLRVYSKILDICRIEGKPTRLRALCNMLPDHTTKVIECFAKIADNTIYILEEEAKTILNAGLECCDESTRHRAKLIRENLLNSGRFVLPDLEVDEDV